MGALWAFLPLIIIFAGFFISEYYKHILKDDLQQKVARLAKTDLFFSIGDVQNAMQEPDFCKLTLEEEQFARSILQKFCEQLQKDFIEGRLNCKRKFYKMTDVSYFMYSLCSFLSDQDFGRKFLDHALCNVVEHKELQGTATWGGKRWEESCDLTDFGITFCKLYFVSARYCENLSGGTLRDSEAIKEILLSGKISFYKL